MKTKLKPCVLCGGRFSEWGNNPAPLKTRGQCCDHCNRTKVIPARLQAVFPTIKDRKLPRTAPYL